MGAGNVDVVRRWIDRYNDRDVEGMIELSAPEIEFRSVFAGIESGGVFRGYAGIVDYFKSLDDAYDGFRVVPDDLVDAGAAVVAVAVAEWCGHESQVRSRTPIFPVCWLRAARIFRVETFVERAEGFRRRRPLGDREATRGDVAFVEVGQVLLEHAQRLV